MNSVNPHPGHAHATLPPPKPFINVTIWGCFEGIPFPEIHLFKTLYKTCQKQWILKSQALATPMPRYPYKTLYKRNDLGMVFGGDPTPPKPFINIITWEQNRAPKRHQNTL